MTPERNAMNMLPDRSTRSACLARLRRQIDRIERGQFNRRPGGNARSADDGFAAFASGEIDPFLAGGGGQPALQELVADGYGSHHAVRDFSLALAASLLHRQQERQDQTAMQGMVLWCQRQRDVFEFGQPYGPGLRTLGLPPDRLLMVTGRRDADCLWAMEQALASRSLLAVIGAVDRVGLTASRRLSLAARAHGAWCLLLPLQHGREPSAARTRWRIKTSPSHPGRHRPQRPRTAQLGNRFGTLGKRQNRPLDRGVGSCDASFPSRCRGHEAWQPEKAYGERRRHHRLRPRRIKHPSRMGPPPPWH